MRLSVLTAILLGCASLAGCASSSTPETVLAVKPSRETTSSVTKDGGPVPAAPFDGYEVLIPARDYRNRHASILLPLEAAAEAIAAAEAAT